jgi:hypothetical protein
MTFEIEILPPIDANERLKGMAEVVMIPVVPALLNAIFAAAQEHRLSRFRAWSPFEQSGDLVVVCGRWTNS